MMARTSRVIIKKNDLKKLSQASGREADKAVGALAFEGEGYLKREMQMTPRGAEGRSLPGNPPAIDTGALWNSISVRRVKASLYSIESGMEYAPVLEFGSYKTEARPVWGPMAKWLRLQAGRVFDNFIG